MSELGPTPQDQGPEPQSQEKPKPRFGADLFDQAKTLEAQQQAEKTAAAEAEQAKLAAEQQRIKEAIEQLETLKRELAEFHAQREQLAEEAKATYAELAEAAKTLPHLAAVMNDEVPENKRGYRIASPDDLIRHEIERGSELGAQFNELDKTLRERKELLAKTLSDHAPLLGKDVLPRHATQTVTEHADTVLTHFQSRLGEVSATESTKALQETVLTRHEQDSRRQGSALALLMATGSRIVMSEDVKDAQALGENGRGLVLSTLTEHYQSKIHQELEAEKQKIDPDGIVALSQSLPRQYGESLSAMNRYKEAEAVCNMQLQDLINRSDQLKRNLRRYGIQEARTNVMANELIQHLLTTDGIQYELQYISEAQQRTRLLSEALSNPSAHITRGEAKDSYSVEDLPTITTRINFLTNYLGQLPTRLEEEGIEGNLRPSTDGMYRRNSSKRTLSQEVIASLPERKQALASLVEKEARAGRLLSAKLNAEFSDYELGALTSDPTLQALRDEDALVRRQRRYFDAEVYTAIARLSRNPKLEPYSDVQLRIQTSVPTPGYEMSGGIETPNEQLKELQKELARAKQEKQSADATLQQHTGTKPGLFGQLVGALGKWQEQQDKLLANQTELAAKIQLLERRIQQEEERVSLINLTLRKELFQKNNEATMASILHELKRDTPYTLREFLETLKQFDATKKQSKEDREALASYRSTEERAKNDKAEFEKARSAYLLLEPAARY